MTVLSDPATGVYAITPDDNNDLPTRIRAIRATVAGNVAIIGADGVAATCAFLAGETRALRITRVKSTGTTATGLEGMY